MLRITIELVPGGNEDRKKVIAAGTIANLSTVGTLRGQLLRRSAGQGRQAVEARHRDRLPAKTPTRLGFALPVTGPPGWRRNKIS